MTFDIAITLLIIFSALILFAIDKLRVDIIALLVLLTVAMTGLVSPKDVFSGFSNSAVITVWAVYIVSGGLFRTGVADMLGKFILRLSGSSEVRLIAVIMLVCGIMSAFMNNVGATAVLLPAVVSISRSTKVPVSKLLIPLSFSSLLGGGLTMIGTPANILATNIVADRGLPTLKFFDFTQIGLVIFIVGILYMVIFGRKLLPIRQTPDTEVNKDLRSYITEVVVIADGFLDGKSLYESRLGEDYDLNLLRLIRDEKEFSPIDRETILHANDVLIMEGKVSKLLMGKDELGLSITTEPHENYTKFDDENLVVVEATIAPRSSIVGKTLTSIGFRNLYGFNALAIYRQGEMITERLGNVNLDFGDALLLRGPNYRVSGLNQKNDFLVLEPVEIATRKRKKMPIAISILVSVILLVLFAGLDIALGMVIGAVSMVLTGCLSMDEAYESIDWRTVFLVAGMLPLGIAMQATGAASYIADLILGLAGDFGPVAILGGVYLLAASITQVMSNAAAMVLVVPIAIDAALGMGANHLTFTLAVAIGASTSFLSPVGHKANVLVFGPGGYKFLDYARVGFLLTVFLFIATMIALPIIYPLFP